MVISDRRLKVNSALLFCIWTCFLSVSWLVPNHNYPWASFHMDAWISLVYLLLAAATFGFFSKEKKMKTGGIPVIIAGILVLITVQYYLGQIFQAGNYVLSSMYLFGFLLAWIVGAHNTGRQRYQVLDATAAALNIASIVSVALQLNQWLQIYDFEIWSMGGGESRPYANLGQPNQLGTILLWGILSTLWLEDRKKLSTKVVSLAIVFMLLGAAMTMSRTVWLNIILLGIIGLTRKTTLVTKEAKWRIALSLVYFCALIFFVRWFANFYWQATPQMNWIDLTTVGSASRPAIWAFFVDAAKQQWLWGYGWNQTGYVHMTLALAHEPLHEYFTSAHNLLLDLMLWCGMPIALIVVGYLIYWMYSRISFVTDKKELILWFMVMVALVHSMLELPLHYAYVLLPLGTIMGSLDGMRGIRGFFSVSKATINSMVVIIFVLLIILIAEYRQVEHQYLLLRFKWANVVAEQPTTPDLVLLTQLRDVIDLALVDTEVAIPDDQFKVMQNALYLFPNVGFFQLLALTEIKRGNYGQARNYLETMCSVNSPGVCSSVGRRWQLNAKNNQEIARIEWPR